MMTSFTESILRISRTHVAINSPHLAVWMWVGASHDIALVLEDLHPLVFLPQLLQLLGPGSYDSKYLLLLHEWEGEVRVWVETHHTAGPLSRSYA